MKRTALFLLAIGVLAAALGVPARAQNTTVQVIATCGSPGGTIPLGVNHLYMDQTGKLCTSGSGGGGGGLSVTDQTAWAVGSSQFTPTGGVFNDSATLSSGQEGTARLTTKRAQIVDVDTSGNALYTAMTSSIPAGTNNIGQVGGSVNITPTDCSGTITTGATAQNAHSAQAALHGMTIANLDTSEVMWFSFTGTAAANTVASYPLAPATATTFAALSSYTTPMGFGYNTALSVIAATTGHKFSCTRW